MKSRKRIMSLPILALILLWLVSCPGGTFPVHLDEEPPMKFINRMVDLTNGLYQGNFTYSYPLDLPGGMGGLSPSLALCYNSELTEEKYLAVGWELTGIASISRETTAAVPTYEDHRDTFLLDLDGRRYRIRNESGTPYFENSAMGLAFDGERWRVTQTDGVVYEFTPGASFAAGIFDWLVESITDPNGNTIKFTYDRSALQDEGVVYPERITYLGEHENRIVVKFAWEDAGDRRFESYWATYKQVYTRRLKSVTIEAEDSTGQFVPVETYEIQYHRSKISANNLLDRIKPANGEAVSFAYWSDETTAGTPLWRNEGKWAFPEEFAANDPASSKRIDYDFLFRDLNQDGYPDLILQERLTDLNYNFNWHFYAERLPRVYLNDREGGWLLSHDFALNMDPDRGVGDGYNNPRTPPDLGSDGSVEFKQEIRPIFTDLNGDGYLDLTFHAIFDTWWEYYQAAQPGPDPFINPPARMEGFRYDQELVSFMNDGHGRFSFFCKRTARRSTSLDERLEPVPQVDMDGDHQADLSPKDEGVAIMIDANADDRADFFVSNQVLFNQGDGTTTIGTHRHVVTSNFFRRLFRGDDLDNDGRIDGWTVERAAEGVYRLRFPDSPQRDLELNDPRLKYCRPYFLTSYNYWNRNIFADLNNDGLMDLFTPSGAYINLAKPDLLSKITDEESAETMAIAYERRMVKAQYGNGNCLKPNINLPDIGRWAVKSVTDPDGQTTTFEYGEGLHDVPSRCFRGYRTVSVSDGTETTVYTFELEDPRLLGMTLKVEGPEETVINEYTIVGTDKKWRIKQVTTKSTTAHNGSQEIVNHYDEHDNLARQQRTATTPEGIAYTTTTEYTYAAGNGINALPSLVKTKNDQGETIQETEYDYDNLENGVSKGNLTRILTKVFPADAGSDDLVTSFAYDQYGRVTETADAFGHATTMETTRTAEGRLHKTTNAIGHVTRQLFDPVTGLLRWSEDANGLRTTYEYYADRRLKKVTAPDGGWTEYLYDRKPDGTRIEVTLTKIAPGNDRLLWSETRTARRWTKTIEKEVVETTTGGEPDGWDRVFPGGNRIKREFATVSRVVLSEQYTNADGQTTSASLPYLEGENPRYIIYTYEPTGKKRLLRVENPDGTYISYTYEDAARRVTATDQAGRSTVTQESYAYTVDEGKQGLRRIEEVTAPDGTVTRSYYSMEGDLLQVTDAKGQNRITKYDNLHRAILTKDPFKGQNTFAYDAAGRLKSMTDNKGVTIEYRYDALGRMTTKRFPSGREIRYLYDLTPADDPIHTNGLGRLGAFVDQSGTTRFGYDAAGRPIAVRRNGFGSVRYGYDHLGQVTSLIYPNNYTVSYQYELGGLTRVADAGRTLATYSGFDAYGLHSKAVFGNGVRTDYTFDPRNGRLTGIRVNQGQLLDLAYSYDQAGNIASIIDRTLPGPQHPRNISETYTYDPNNRLISASGPYGTKTYEYDAVGNFTYKEGVSYRYTDPSCPYAVTEGSDGFRASYDYNGNMVSKTDPLGDRFVYTYDEENHLIKAVRNGTHVEDFVYDANGMRVRRIANGATTDYFFHGVNLLYEVTGGAAKNYVWANGTLLCTVEDNEYTYYHTDHLGTSKLQTDGQGKVISIDITKPYGPVAKDGVMADSFVDLSKIDTNQSYFRYDDTTGTILPPRWGFDRPKQVMDRQEVTVEKTEYERVKNVRIIRTSSDQGGTELSVQFDFVGKARLTAKNAAGDTVFQEEYESDTPVTTITNVPVGYQPNQALVIDLELAAKSADAPARNMVFSVFWGRAGASQGFISSLPQTFQTEVNSVRLSYTGSGVNFYLNTSGNLWQKIEPGVETILDQPGRTLTLRAYLPLEDGTNLQDYQLEINPYHDMSFTGKFLEPEIGLIYFGGRWYEPGIGRWVTVDPAEDGENWYGYCGENPKNRIDPDGRFSYWWQPVHLLAGPFLYAWDLIVGIKDFVCEFWPYMIMPFPIGSILMGIDTAEAVVENPRIIIDFAAKIGWGLVGDVVETVRRFPNVCLGRPTDAQVREYGKNVTGTVLTVITVVKAVKAIKSAVSVAKTATAVGTTTGASTAINQATVGSKYGLTWKQLREVIESWDKGTFKTRAQSIRYHWATHGDGRNLLEYTRAANSFATRNQSLFKYMKPSWRPNWVASWFYENTQGGGYFSELGKILTFWGE